MIKFLLHTFLKDRGKVAIEGREYGEDQIIFDHPVADEPIVLQVSRTRAMELSAMDRHTENRLNLHMERFEVYEVRVGRNVEHPNVNLESYPCPYCSEAITKITEDFSIHAIPSCPKWKQENPY